MLQGKSAWSRVDSKNEKVGENRGKGRWPPTIKKNGKEAEPG